MLFTSTVKPDALALLYKLMRVSELAPFLLVGGTNLSLRYGHRLSVDLYLFTNEPFFRDEVYDGIRRELPQTTLLDQRRQTLWLTIDGIKVDVILHEYPYLKGVDEVEGIRLLVVEAIIPMKLEAMATGGVKKDFWHIAELSEHFALAQMLTFYQQKYPNSDSGHVLLAMTYFADAEVEKIDPQSLTGQTWPQVKDTLRKVVHEYVRGNISR